MSATKVNESPISLETDMDDKDLILLLANTLKETELGNCLMCDNCQKHIPVIYDGLPRGCDGNCRHEKEYTTEEFLDRFIGQYKADLQVLERRKDANNI